MLLETVYFAGMVTLGALAGFVAGYLVAYCRRPPVWLPPPPPPEFHG